MWCYLSIVLTQGDTSQCLDHYRDYLLLPTGLQTIWEAPGDSMWMS